YITRIFQNEHVSIPSCVANDELWSWLLALRRTNKCLVQAHRPSALSEYVLQSCQDMLVNASGSASVRQAYATNLAIDQLNNACWSGSCSSINAYSEMTVVNKIGTNAAQFWLQNSALAQLLNDCSWNLFGIATLNGTATCLAMLQAPRCP